MEYRGTAISYVMAGGVVAALVGPNLAHWTSEWLVALFAGSYLALAGILVLSFAIQLFLDIPRPPRDAHGGRSLGVIARQPVFIVAAIGAPRPLPVGSMLKRLGASGLVVDGVDLRDALEPAYAAFAGRNA